MTYYPNSQLKTNLYTNGEEYILSSTNQPYKGNYYELSSGKKYTGSSPNDKPNILLILNPTNFPSDIEVDNSTTIHLDDGHNPPSNINSYQITNISDYPNYKYSPTRSIPSYNPTIPTQKDYDLGVFQRYFCKKNNELVYIEIDKTTFQQLNSNSNKIAWDLYSALSLNWYLTGDKSKVYNANKGLSTLIETKEKWHGFTQYFKDKYLKYYLES